MGALKSVLLTRFDGHWMAKINGYYVGYGPTAMVAHGTGIENYAEEISDINHITAVSPVQMARAYLRMDQNEVYQGSPDDPIDPMFMMTGNAFSIPENFAEAFPDEFVIVDGRYPEDVQCNCKSIS